MQQWTKDCVSAFTLLNYWQGYISQYQLNNLWREVKQRKKTKDNSGRERTLWQGSLNWRKPISVASAVPWRVSNPRRTCKCRWCLVQFLVEFKETNEETEWSELTDNIKETSHSIRLRTGQVPMHIQCRSLHIFLLNLADFVWKRGELSPSVLLLQSLGLCQRQNVGIQSAPPKPELEAAETQSPEPSTIKRHTLAGGRN